MDTIQSIKEEARQNVSNYSLETLHRFVDDYQIFNAQRSIEHGGTDTFYTLDRAQEILGLYDDIGMQCRSLYYQFSAELDEVEEEEAVWNLVNYYRDLYDSLGTN